MSSGFCNIEQIEPDTEGDWDDHHREDTGIDPGVVLHRPGEIEDDADDDEPVSEGLASAVLGGEESSEGAREILEPSSNATFHSGFHPKNAHGSNRNPKNSENDVVDGDCDAVVGGVDVSQRPIGEETKPQYLESGGVSTVDEVDDGEEDDPGTEGQHGAGSRLGWTRQRR